MTRSIRKTMQALSVAGMALAAAPSHAAFLDTPLAWNEWLGIGSGLMLVVALVLAAARRTEGGGEYHYQGPRRTRPMPLYEEGATA